MSGIITPAPIRKSIHVNAAPARAFDIFTAGMARWWIKTHSINPTKSPIKDIVIEPHPGGRWFERGEDGSECQWGKVLAWEPPADQREGRLLLAWQITGPAVNTGKDQCGERGWRYDPAVITEIEIRFVPESGGTHVELEHRHLERLAEHAEAMARTFAGGWTGLLESFAKATA